MTEQEVSALISKANAWDFLDKWFANASNNSTFKEIADEVSQDLFRNGCHSAAVHRASVIDKLLGMVEELREEVSYLESYSKSS